jgi:hypothetical protein
MALPANDRDEILAAVERVGGHTAWGVAEPLTGYDLHIQPGKFVERLLAESIYLLNLIMSMTPVETLDGVEHPENLAHARLPLSLFDIRLIWQLGLDSPITAA